jgi:hypothetical protein
MSLELCTEGSTAEGAYCVYRNWTVSEIDKEGAVDASLTDTTKAHTK